MSSFDDKAASNGTNKSQDCPGARRLQTPPQSCCRPQSSSDDVTQSVPASCRLVPSVRLGVSLMCFFLMCEMFLLRVNISMAIVCMVRTRQTPATSQDEDHLHFSNVSDSEQVRNNTRVTPTTATSYTSNGFAAEESFSATTDWIETPVTVDPKLSGEFEWGKRLQGLILSSYFFGYLSTQALGGWLGGKFGAKHVIGCGLLLSAAATILIPAAARITPHLVIVLRIIVGAGSGVFLTNVMALLGLWAPPLERTILSSFSYSGMTVGIITVFLLSSNLCMVQVDNGWPFIFYLTGGFGLLVWIGWNVVVHSSPERHPWIGVEELRYIERCTGRNTISRTAQRRPPFPWLQAMRSPAVLANIAANVANTWFLYTSLMTFPMYMKDVLKFNIRQNGFFMMLPNVLVLVFNLPFGLLADMLRRRGLMTTATVRKLYQCSACFGCAVLMFSLSFLNHQMRSVAVAINVALAVCSNCLSRAGALVNPQDLAPRYAGEVFGIVNTIGTLSGIIAPITVSILTTNGTAEEWKTVFYISCAVSSTGGILFAIFAKGEVLNWAKVNDDHLPTMKIFTLNLTHNKNQLSR